MRPAVADPTLSHNNDATEQCFALPEDSARGHAQLKEFVFRPQIDDQSAIWPGPTANSRPQAADIATVLGSTCNLLEDPLHEWQATR